MGYEQTASSKKRMVGLLIALIFHALLIYALITGLARDFIKKAQKTLDVSIIQEVKLPPPPPPPPPPPKETQPQKVVEQPKAYVPPVEVAVEPNKSDTISSVTSDTPPPPKMEAAPTAVAPAPPPAPPPKPKVRVKPVLASGCKPPKYPAESLEMEESGTVVLSFQVDTSGQVTASKLVKSSGFTRLDDAAKAAFEICRFTPGMVDDVPEVSWVQQSFEWKLSN